MTVVRSDERKVVRMTGRLPSDGSGATITIRGTRVSDVSLRPVDTGSISPDLWILPGLFDMQINGYGGHDMNADDVTAETVIAMVRAIWQKGVALCCPTVITGSPERMSRSIAAIAQACRQDADVDAAVAGIHVEGPYISSVDGPRGAHPPQHVRAPDWDEFVRWQAIAEGRIRVITVAPEIEGVVPFIRRARASGVTVALGHTGAQHDDIRAAIEAGATMSTHLGNGSHATVPRLHNSIWEQLAADELCASIIVDGHHLPPAVVKSFYRVKGLERLVLISDASPIAGLQPGRYPGFYGEVELHANGRIEMVDAPYLAGSGMNLVDCINTARAYTGATLMETVKMASYNPERLLGLVGKTGAFVSGSSATFSIFEKIESTLRPRATVLLGRLVWHDGGFQKGEAFGFS